MRATIIETYTYSIEVIDESEIDFLQDCDHFAGTELVDKITNGEAKLTHIQRSISKTKEVQ